MGKTEEKLGDVVEERPSVAKKTKLLTRYDENKSRTIPNIKQIQQSNDFGVSTDKTVAVQNISSVDLDDLEQRVKSMMEKIPNKVANGRGAYICKLCGKEGRGDVIKDHIEANHLEGMEFPCDLRGKTSRTRHALNVHKHTLCKYK